MDEPLLPFWSAWQVTRAADIARAGYPKSVANTIANREARSRMFVEKLISRDAALDCDLVTEYRADGSLGVYAQIERAEVPKPLRQRADGWAAMNGLSTATPRH